MTKQQGQTEPPVNIAHGSCCLQGSPVKSTEEKRWKRKKKIKQQDEKLETPEENEDIMQDCKDIEESFFFKLVLRGDGLLVRVGGRILRQSFRFGYTLRSNKYHWQQEDGI